MLALASALLKMLKFLVTIYLLNFWMDLVDILPDVRYWSEILHGTHFDPLQKKYMYVSGFISEETRYGHGQGHGLRNFTLKFLVKVFESLLGMQKKKKNVCFRFPDPT